MRSFTIAFKVKAIDFLRDGHSVSETGRKYHVDRKRIRDWNRQYERLLVENIGTGKVKRKLHHGRRSIFDQLSSMVHVWYDKKSQQDGNDVLIPNKEIQLYAVKTAGQLQLKTFRASPAWISQWKKRYGIS